MSHSNISIFVPHSGCTHQCSFCNQRYITGQNFQPNADDVHNAVSNAVSSSKYNPLTCEIAFFGGSFTGISMNYMIELLEAAYEYVKSGIISGIRISTRPDYINKDILNLLKKYGVSAIELGAQSMVDKVLLANNRGHLSSDVKKASELIKSFNFELGLQMMTGLFKSSEDDDIYTAEKILEIMPDTVRIYPTIVIKNTDLERLYLSGVYKPQSLDSAVSLCVKLEDMFLSSGIKVIRIGLHSVDMEAYVSGPWHPAFRELCESQRFRSRLDAKITCPGNYSVFVNPSQLSKFIGQKRSNVKYFLDRNIEIKIIPCSEIDTDNFSVEEVK